MVPEILRVTQNLTKILESRILKAVSGSLKFCITPQSCSSQNFPYNKLNLESGARFL